MTDRGAPLGSVHDSCQAPLDNANRLRRCSGALAMKLLERMVRLDDGAKAFDDGAEMRAWYRDIGLVLRSTRVHAVPHAAKARGDCVRVDRAREDGTRGPPHRRADTCDAGELRRFRNQHELSRVP